MAITRRATITGAGASLLLAAGWSRAARAAAGTLPLAIAAKSPWLPTSAAVSGKDEIFLGLPRWPGHEATPSLVKIRPDGSLRPFPGGAWNGWRPGADGLNAFVFVNTVHIFDGRTIWCVDTGAEVHRHAKPGAQKLVQLDCDTGAVLQIVRFDRAVTPAGARVNDLRFHASLIYMTENGLGALIVHDLRTGRSIRRLAGRSVTAEADLIEVSPDGQWLYWAPASGPVFRRIRTRYLTDPRLSDDDLLPRVEVFCRKPSSGGSCMDTLGNLYISDADRRRIILRSPAGREAVLVSDPGLISPDALFIDRHRTLYIPASQIQSTRLFRPRDTTHRPFLIYSAQLPDTFQGIKLGAAIPA